MWRALAISLAAHALLLWPGAAQRLPERAAGALVATLRPVAEVAAPAPAPTAAPRSAASLQPRMPVAVAPAAVSPERPAGSALGVPTFLLPAPLANTTSTDGGTERSATVAAVPAPAAVAGGGAGVDADGLRQYRLALAREARRFKRYPQRALQAGIGGTVEVRVELGVGAMPLARLVRSSGDESLDAAALDMVRQATLRTAVPESLRGRAVPVELPVIFNASEE